ncbi:hypothetical protein MtrunA17_Chr1g0152741 [Medicago truncatula]|uniref:Uncharacterized protein n=1 Tax=Medicago truncatula TaxID=3880 RepID=A0A396JQB4_MEDTR|nr:hypothetical protein MtrunA17_Chr1g0152741 [Medicago truncatula]
MFFSFLNTTDASKFPDLAGTTTPIAESRKLKENGHSIINRVNLDDYSSDEHAPGVGKTHSGPIQHR